MREQIIALLRRLQRWRGGPVRTQVLADLLGRSVRTVRWWLRKLERAGAVWRPAGPKRGWAVV